MNIEKASRLAFNHFSSGNLERATQTYKEILRTQGNNVQALYFLGLIYYQTGNYDLSIKYLQEVIRLDPINAETYINLGDSFYRKGSRDEAIMCYKKALQINPKSVDARIHLGSVLVNYQRYDEAISCCQEALKIVPDDAELYNILGNAYRGKGLLNESLMYFKKELQKNPYSVEAYNNMGIIFHHKGLFDEAIMCYQKALNLDPSLDAIYINMGNVLQEKGDFSEAVKYCQKALQLNPSSNEAFNNLGNIFKDMGLLDEAESYYRRAMRSKANDAVSYDNLLMIMNYNSRYDAKAVFSEHLRFAEQFAEPLRFAIAPHANNKNLDRRLRIGYVSPDFRQHSVSYFFEPILAAHNREEFEVFCYSSGLTQDKVTERLRGYADQWRNIAGASDGEAAELVRSDGIDILVDLAGHTAHNRLLLFARKPAPVQVSWIGYPGTTGLSSMDYKIVDRYTDPPGMTECFYTEKLIRMPESFLCYLPDSESPEVGALPARSSGHITFGSFNDFAKVSAEVIKLWIAIMKAIPDCRLIMKAKSFSDKSTRENVVAMFVRNGVAIERIDLLSKEPSAKGHLDTYNRIDIALDTFPYNGTTTTCEALWMGVPVITLAGNSHAGRVGVSLLSNIGLPELVAKTRAEYVDIVAGLAADIGRLQRVREELREMMSHSPLTDAKRVTGNLESHYRSMWERWCAGEPAQKNLKLT